MAGQIYVYDPSISFEDAVVRAQSHPDPKIRAYDIRAKEHFFENVIRHFRVKPCTPETYQKRFDLFIHLYVEPTGIPEFFWKVLDDSTVAELAPVTFALIFREA